MASCAVGFPMSGHSIPALISGNTATFFLTGWRDGCSWTLGRKIWINTWVSACLHTYMRKCIEGGHAISCEFRSFLGAWPSLLVTDHNMLQQIFITKFKFFSDRGVSQNN